MRAMVLMALLLAGPVAATDYKAVAEAKCIDVAAGPRHDACMTLAIDELRERRKQRSLELLRASNAGQPVKVQIVPR